MTFAAVAIYWIRKAGNSRLDLIRPKQRLRLWIVSVEVLW